MKLVSIPPKIFLGTLLLFSLPVFGQTEQEKIQGTWKLHKYEMEKTFNVSDKLINELIGTVFTFNNCMLTISKEENGVNNSKSGIYSLIGNKLTIGVDQPAAEIILLNDTELRLKLPHQQGTLYFSKS